MEGNENRGIKSSNTPDWNKPESIDNRLRVLLGMDEDEEFFPANHALSLGLLIQKGFITQDLRLTEGGIREYEKLKTKP